MAQGFLRSGFGHGRKAQPARPIARDVWRMEDNGAKTNIDAGSCSMAIFALYFPDKPR
jgi:hypothetical protein